MIAPIAEAPFATRWLAAVIPHLPPAALAELQANRLGSQALREALADVASSRAVAVMPSRAELGRAWSSLPTALRRAAA